MSVPLQIPEEASNAIEEEMRRIMMNVGEPVTISDINDLIGEVDKNGDGYVDYEVRERAA